MDLIFLTHLIATCLMCGVIWIVQLVHYPSFKFISAEKFLEFERFHCNRISIIVMPIMSIEFLSGAFILFNNDQTPLFILNFIGLVLIWISTFFIQSSLHSKLLLNYSLKNIQLLVKTNWIRTFLWSMRVFLLIKII
jgi:hypothetical protein